MEISLGLAFAAGVLSFPSPCVLALVPVYLAYLGETARSLSMQASSLRPVRQEAAGLLVIALDLLMTGLFGPVLSRFGFRLDGITLLRVA